MLKTIFSIIILFAGLNRLAARTETRISEITCYNLGDGRYYCHYDKDEKPLQGKMRIIDGRTSRYTDAEFNKGIPNGSWKTYVRYNLVPEYIYKAGVFHGENKEFYEDGTLQREIRTENRRDVEDKRYHGNGKLWQLFQITASERLELVEAYDTTGKRTK
jgi:antitoxin component YwqK of YwqJK toxin-antitoxin module